MLVQNNPEIDVAQLLDAVRGDLSRTRHIAHLMVPSPSAGEAREASWRVGEVRRLVEVIYARSQSRTRLPDFLLRRLPLFRLPLIGRVLLKIHNVLFHDQRIANGAMVDALKNVADELAALRNHREAEGEALRTAVMERVDEHLGAMARQLEATQATILQQARTAQHLSELVDASRRTEALLRELIGAAREDIAGLRLALVKPNGHVQN